MGLGYVLRHFEPIIESLQNRYPTEAQVNTHEAYRFLRETTPLLEEAGFGIIAPEWWDQKGARLGVHLQLTPAAQKPGAKIPVGKLKSLIHWLITAGNFPLAIHA